MIEWVWYADPPVNTLVLVTICGSDFIKLRAGETIEDCIKRVRKEGRHVTLGVLDDVDGWLGPDYMPLMIKPVAWAALPEPFDGEV